MTAQAGTEQRWRWWPLIGCMLVSVLLVASFASTLYAQDGPRLVINEIDYDQPSTDTAEFIELYNGGTATVNLDPYILELVNGANNGAAVYTTVDLPAVDLAPGAYYVVCGNPATVANCDLDGGADTNFIQNGAPDAVGLRLNGAIVDTVSYEGEVPGYTEGTGAPEDPAAGTESIARCPDGQDTNNNSIDFHVLPSTPGSANCPPTVTPTATATTLPGTPTSTPNFPRRPPRVMCANSPRRTISGRCRAPDRPVRSSAKR